MLSRPSQDASVLRYIDLDMQSELDVEADRPQDWREVSPNIGIKQQAL